MVPEGASHPPHAKGYAMPTCTPCKTDFTRFMMVRHLARKHRMDECRLCEGSVRTFQVTPLGATLDYCSGACVAEVIRRGLCFKCLRSHASTLGAYFCLSCVPVAQFNLTAPGSQRSGDILDALKRANWLPRVYLRANADAWKLSYIRREHVA